MAVVTGASRGIGNAVAVGLAQAGFDIVGVARSSPELDLLGDEVRGYDRDFVAIVSDLSDATNVAHTARLALDWKGGVDVLVNAAGRIVRSEPPEIRPEDIDATFALNVRAPLLLSQALSPSLASKGDGSIVNVASLAAEIVTRASVSYQASKAALVQVTRALAERWGPEIRVNAVGPGYIETSLNRAWLSEEENRAYVETHTALRRVGQPQDVVGAVVFLASQEARYITGQHLIVDGGWRAG